MMWDCLISGTNKIDNISIYIKYVEVDLMNVSFITYTIEIVSFASLHDINT